MFMQNPTVRDHAPTVIISLEVGGRALMTRDMELIRKIFAQVKGWTSVDLRAIELPDVDPSILARHLEMLHNAGFIEAEKSVSLHGPLRFAVKDLTWAGHDFAAAIENDSVWNAIKQKLGKGACRIAARDRQRRRDGIAVPPDQVHLRSLERRWGPLWMHVCGDRPLGSPERNNAHHQRASLVFDEPQGRQCPTK
jgi:hypothetical protein